MVEHQNKSKFRDIFEDSEKKRQSYKLKSAYSKRRASAGGFFNKKEE